MNSTGDRRDQQANVHDRTSKQLANKRALNDLPYSTDYKLPNRITDQLDEQSSSLNGSQSDSDFYSDKNSIDCDLNDSINSDSTTGDKSICDKSTCDKSTCDKSTCAKFITSDQQTKSDITDAKSFDNHQNKFLNIDQLETYFKDSNLEEINLNLDDLIKLESNLKQHRTSISHPSARQSNQCLKKSPKSRFLAKRNSRQVNKMNKEVLINNKWTMGPTSSIGSMGSSPILLSPCSSSSECPASSVEMMRLSNLGSSLSTYSLCSRSSSSNALNENDEMVRKAIQDSVTDDFYNDEIAFSNEMTHKSSDKYELFDITRSMPSLNLIESLNGNLPRLLKQYDKQFDSQPKLYDAYYSHKSIKPISRTDQINESTINDDASLTNSQKLIMTRFGFIRNVPAAKNLIMNSSLTFSNEDENDERAVKSMTNHHLIKEPHSNEMKKSSISSVDLSKPTINEQLNLPKSIYQRSLSALTINCDHRLNKTIKYICTTCSSNQCKCKVKANSLLAINHQTALSIPPKPKLFKKPNLEVSCFYCYIFLVSKNDYSRMMIFFSIPINHLKSD